MTVYQVVIADDEILFRKKLREMIDWEALDFEVAAAFGNGQRVMEYVKENPVDVVLTDIRMSPVSGLELAQYLHEDFPHVKVVLISGYREFEYAQAAIQFGVTDYLVKPVGRDAVRNTLLRIKEEWKAERSQGFSHLSIRQAFLNLLSGDKTDGAEQQLADAGIHLCCAQAQYLLAQMEILNFHNYLAHYSYGKEGFYNSFCQMVPKCDAGIYYCVLHISEEKFTILAVAQNQERMNLKENVRSMLNRVMRDIRMVLKAEPQMNFRERVYELEELRQAFKKQIGEVVIHTAEKVDSVSPVKKAEEYICANYWKDICQEEVAEYVGLSVYYFSRLFKNITQEKFVDYIIRIRMEKAKELLMNTDMKVAEISQKVGYANYSTFHRIFKGTFGCAPGEYRAALNQ
ncbi:response regulator transcription factor [Ructibacterium gallinarum]|uniref:Stage 0 sporulation protein A homolog n=1 Tax=Ructibacterium gallinarum TaxID=2779355 RepID=A0A9D5RB60_9FIRM|nr:helix-turn-helix domain-containing protein [Ructibacterium gallinarum]MBE5039703.1 response regulator [Ructibacterium gallinarum]